jgi:DNA-directed RNA polymerase subunit F
LQLPNTCGDIRERENLSTLKKREITITEAKEILEARAEELDPLQRRVLDYVNRFSKLTVEETNRLVEELIDGNLLDKGLAVQIANCMPSGVEEIRTFLGRQRIISEDTINEIIMKIEKYRSS